MANGIKLDTKDAQKEVGDLIKSLENVKTVISEVSSEALKMSKALKDIKKPSDMVDMGKRQEAQINALTKTIEKNEAIIASLRKKSVSDAEKEAKAKEKLLEREQRARERLASQRQREERQNEAAQRREEIRLRALNSAYVQLSNAEALAARTLQDLIARGRTATQTQREYNREVASATSNFQGLRSRLLQADEATGRWNRTGTRTISMFRDLFGALGIVGGVTMLVGFIKEVFTVTKELQSLDLALKQVSKSDADFAENQQFLTRIAEAYGAEIKSLTKQFTQFYVSAKDKLGKKEIERIFESITKASGAMGLSVDAQERAFLALNQMMSKGTVSAEELKGQLGEALPGAFGIMAKAIGVTEKELGKMLQKGEILAADVLPKFAKQLEISFGIENLNRVESLSASTTRLSNSWTDFIRSLNGSQGALSTFFSFFVDELKDTITWWTKLNNETRDFKEIISEKQQGGYDSQLKALRSEAEKTGVSFKDLARVRQDQAIKQREINKIELNEAKEKATKMAKWGSTKLLSDQNEKIRELAKSYAFWNGVVKITNDILTEKVKLTEEENEETETPDMNRLAYLKEQKKKTEELRETQTNTFQDYIMYFEKIENIQKEIDKIEGKREPAVAIESQVKASNSLLDALEKQKKFFEEVRQATARNSKEYEYWTKLIEGSQNSIDLITDPSKVIKAGEGWEKALKQMSNASSSLDEQLKKSEQQISSYLGKFKDEFVAQSGFNTLFEVLENKIPEFGKNWKTTFVAMAEVAQEAYAFINQSAQANFDVQKQNTDLLRDNALAYAETEEQKAAINKQYDNEIRRIKNEQAEQAKQQAIFNILINTAQAVVATLGQTGFFGIPLSLAVGAIGAAQLAIVSNQEVPKYKNGVRNAAGGAAIVGDGGVSEFIKTPDGKIFKTPNVDTLVNLEKGSDVFKNEKDLILNNPQLANFEQKDNSISIIRGIDGAMGKYFAKIQVNQTTIDRNGINQWSINQGNRSKQIANSFSSKGFDV